MSRDSLFGESILWQGNPAPKGGAVPARYRAVAAMGATFALVAVAFAVVSATAVHARVGGMLMFAAWCATVAVAAWRGPAIWQSGVEYLITDKHVIWRRGPIRRTIDRAAISYAIIRWNPRSPGTGDLVLVRAVPTGALRRTLSLTLSNVVGPDRLWAIVRGLTPSAPLGDGERPLAQRLDAGERVVWSGTPTASPWTVRRAATATVAVMVLGAAVRVVLGSAHGIGRLLRTHALPAATTGLLIGGVAVTVLLMLAIAAKVADTACLQPGRLARSTRYLVTDQRVLIRRGQEELHLDRARITYVITAPVKHVHDVFLVLDGPQARALAASGAFGEDGGDKLRPVLAAVEDADAVTAILRAPIPSEPSLDRAA